MQSILDQSFRDFELIALDDGSEDGSLDVLHDMAASDARIRVISHENCGITPTLNKGMTLAGGEFIARMDCDDLAMPDRFARQIAFLDTHPEIVATGGQMILIDPEGRYLRTFRLPLDHDGIDQRHLGDPQMGMGHPTVMMRTQALRDVGGYREQFKAAQDIDLWLRLAEIGKLANIDAVTLEYRLHPKAVGFAKRNIQRQAAWQAAKDAAERRSLPFDTPTPDPQDTVVLYTIYRRWGWWALKDGNVATARHYAKRALLARPLDKGNWQLVVCALRGY